MIGKRRSADERRAFHPTLFVNREERSRSSSEAASHEMESRFSDVIKAKDVDSTDQDCVEDRYRDIRGKITCTVG